PTHRKRTMSDADLKSTPLTREELRDLLCFARYKARQCIKERWRSEGLKLSEWSMRDLRIASEQYLADHWAELKPKPAEMLAYSKAQDENQRGRKGTRTRTRPSEQATKAEEAQP